MPNSDRVDRAQKVRRVKRAPTAAENRAAFKEIQRNVKAVPKTKADVVVTRRVVRAAKAGPVAKAPSVRRARAAVKETQASAVRASARSERASERPDADLIVERFKQSKAYLDAYQDARAANVERTGSGILGKDSVRRSLEKRDKRETFKHQDGFDQPRSDAEVRKFLLDGQPVARGKGIDVVKADMAAGSLKVLEQLTRPVHATAGAADAALKGENVPKAALRGIRNQDKKLFSDVLKTAGAPKVVQTVGGFGLDVLADPTTYLTFGTGTLAKKAAVAEAKRVQEKAFKAGLSKEAAERLGRLAGERALKAAPEGKGLTVRFAGREAPGVRRGTAAAARGSRRAVRVSTDATGRTINRAGSAVTPTRAKPYVKGKRDAVVNAGRAVGPGSKNLVRDVRPTLTPAGMNASEFARVHDAAAAARGKSAAATEAAQRFARAVQKHVPAKADQARVIDAIERKKIGSLPEHLRQPAIRIRSELRGQRRTATRAGVAVRNVEKGRQPGDARGYFPHALDEALTAGKGVDEAAKVAGVGRRTIKLGAAQKRADRRPISAINKETPGKFSEDLPLVLANHISQTGNAAARAQFNRELAKVGRPVKFEDNIVLRNDEALYAIKGSDIKTVKAGDSRIEGARYFAINKNLAERELASLAPIKEATAIGRAFNQGNRGFKRLATLTPAFHIRNAIGDTQLAYLSQPGHRLAVNSGQAVKVLRSQRRQGKQVDRLEFPRASGKTVKVGGKRVPVEQVLKASQDNAATQTGFIGRELNDLVGRDPTGAVKKVRRGSGAIQNTLQARENLMRVSTFKHGLDEGRDAAKAARISRRTHIDYGDLTDFERQARRLMPFYTFSARSIPLHAEKLFTNPGKFAQYQKIREEGANALGLADGYELTQQEFQQRMAAIPAGKALLISAGLPMPSALNELPTSLNAGAYAKELGQFATSQITPLVKAMVELQTGKNTFSRTDIEPPNRTLVPAPIWAAKLPEAIREKLGVTTITDRNGARVPAWPGKTNYLARQALIGPLGQANSISTPGTNPRGTTGTLKTVSTVSGIKIDKVDEIGTKLTGLYKEQKKLTQKVGDMRLERKAVGRDGFYTPEYEALLDEQKALTDTIDRLKKQGGQKDAPTGKRRVKRSSGGSGGWGGSSSGGSGGSSPWGGSSGGSSSSSDPWG